MKKAAKDIHLYTYMEEAMEGGRDKEGRKKDPIFK